MKARRLPVALLAALLALPAAASAAPAPNAPCAVIVAPGRAIELPVQVAPGLTVRVRDPYGGLIARNRLFVAFSIRYANPADRARVASVTWTLDGQPRRAATRAGAISCSRRRRCTRPAGTSSACASSRWAAARAVEAELQVTATDCQLASLAPLPDARGGLAVDVASGGPALRTIALTPGSGRFGAPRGGRLGTVGAARRTRAHAARPALRRGGRALRIEGLPPGTTTVRVRLAAGVVAPVTAARCRRG